tara:strand:- start:557 stop:949 length:393 start_codon:yes stop_codon:yes gene_type:complete
MKQLIKDVLEDLSKGQVNLGSEAAREMVATAIMSAIRTSDKGWFLDLNPSAKDKSIDKLKYKIESESDHNDGWTKQYYKDKLSEAIVDNKEERYIFESPDGGKTVYKRKFGDDKRELVDEEVWKKKKNLN